MFSALPDAQSKIAADLIELSSFMAATEALYWLQKGFYRITDKKFSMKKQNDKERLFQMG